MKEQCAMHDLFTGFEGEPEVRFRLLLDGTCVEEVRIWGGDFRQLIELLPVTPSGWQGLALRYHLLDAWDVAPWRVHPIEEIVAQWASLDPTRLAPRPKRAHALILGLLTRALKSGEAWIESW